MATPRLAAPPPPDPLRRPPRKAETIALVEELHRVGLTTSQIAILLGITDRYVRYLMTVIAPRRSFPNVRVALQTLAVEDPYLATLVHRFRIGTLGQHIGTITDEDQPLVACAHCAPSFNAVSDGAAIRRRNRRRSSPTDGRKCA